MRSFCIPLITLVFALPAAAEEGKLRERLTPEVMAVVYPGAERLGMEEGSPPAIAVFKGDQVVAYVFSTPRHHRGARLFDDTVRCDRRRRSQRPHHGRQGGVPPGVHDRSRHRAAASARHAACARGRAGRCAAAPTRCRRTTSTVQRSARAPCAPPSSLPRGWFCARTPHVQPRGPPRRRLTPL